MKAIRGSRRVVRSLFAFLFLFGASPTLLAAPPETERENKLKRVEENAQKAHDELEGKPAEPVGTPP